MIQQKPIAVTAHVKGYKKCVGKYVADNEVKPMIFRLGHDHVAAIDAAERVLDLFAEPGIVQDGIWTKRGLEIAWDRVNLAQNCRNELRLLADRIIQQSVSNPTPLPAAQPATDAGVTLHEAIAAYKVGHQWQGNPVGELS